MGVYGYIRIIIDIIVITIYTRDVWIGITHTMREDRMKVKERVAEIRAAGLEKRSVYVLTNHVIPPLEKIVAFLKWLRHATGPSDRSAYSWIITDLSDLLETYRLVAQRLGEVEDYGPERISDDPADCGGNGAVAETGV